MSTRTLNAIKASYVTAVIALLGVVSFITAVLISWPALAYLASKIFV